jgi:hypothetical protein
MRFIQWLAVTLAALALGVSLAHGRSSVPHSDSALTTPIYQDNPNEYLMGMILRVKLAHSGRTAITVLDVSPTNTRLLFFQTVQFCGDVTDQLQKGVVVFTYSRVRHTMDCNELFRIDAMSGSAQESGR